MVHHARPSEAIAEQAIRDRERLRGVLHARAREGMPLVERWVNETPGVSWLAPHAGIFAFPRFPAGIDTLALSELLRAEYETLVSPGDFFGAPGHIRIGVARGPQIVTEGLARLTKALERARSKIAS
jgi:aspartate/methionine/tyrosine aminotransferase